MRVRIVSVGTVAATFVGLAIWYAATAASATHLTPDGLTAAPQQRSPAAANPPPADSTVGTIAATFDGERRVFTLVDARSGEYDHWGSGWLEQANVLSAVLWGAEGLAEDAARADDAFVIHLSFWLEGDGDFAVEPLTHRCGSMDNYAEWVVGGLGGQNILQGEDDCGGITIDVIRFEEDANVYVVEGRFAGTMNRGDGAGVTDGAFHARLSEYTN